MGGATADIAQARPDTDYLGVEVHGPGVGSLLLVEERQLGNAGDSARRRGSVHPYAGPGQPGRRACFSPTLAQKAPQQAPADPAALCRPAGLRIKPGGYLHLATDWEDYAIQMLEVLSQEATLENTADGYARARTTAR